MNEVCEDCRFYRPHNDDPSSSFGKCHRFPPQVIDGMGMDNFPRVACVDWCGEFQRKSENPA